MTPAELAHEAEIKRLGDAMALAYGEWARTGSVLAREEMGRHFCNFKLAVTARTPNAVAALKAQKIGTQ